MCPAIKKSCKFCNKNLSYNNKIGFCFECFPKKEAIKLFKEGKTIIQISEKIFNSNSGNYRELIRSLLKKEFGSKFLEIRKNNKNEQIKDRIKKNLPLDFIRDLHNQGKLATQIHKALLQKNYKLHLCTLRKILLELSLDYVENYRKWLTGRSKLSIKRKKLIKELWKEGNSVKNISKTLGLAALTVKTYLHKMGFKTKMLQYYYSEPMNSEESEAKDYLKEKGFEVKKCLFMCQRKLEKGFGEILWRNNFPFPKKLREFCKGCPIKKLKFEEQELYDFMIKKNGKYEVVEVKKVYKNPHRRAHFTLGQFLNLPKIIKANIPFRLIFFDGGELYERRF